MDRRKALKTLIVTGSASLIATEAAASGMIKPWEYVEKRDQVKNTDGTPLQFEAKGAPDANPTEKDIEKYPTCPYCGMSRKMWNHSRHLIHYGDNVVDATCSIHCASISLSVNLDRMPKAIYVGDFGAEGKIKPLADADKATYLIGSKLKGTMTGQSKMAFADPATAKEAQAENGGELGDFNAALTASFTSMASDIVMIRKRRAKRRERKGGKMNHGEGKMNHGGGHKM